MADFIKRAKRKSNFTTVNNDYLQDVNLSWKAKGLITYIMSLPDDWQLNISDLKNRSKDGRDSTANGVNELIENGYCFRVKQRNSGGMFVGYDYTVSDIKEFQPITENPETEPKTENTYSENPVSDYQNTENPEQINTNNTNNLFKQNTNSRVKPENSFSDTPAQTLFSENNFDSKPQDENKEKKVAPKKESTERKTLFRNSEVYGLVDFSAAEGADYSEFEKLYNTPEFNAVDLVYYFHTVSDWSDTKNMKRTKAGWIATVRNFVRGDAEKNKVKLKPEFQVSKAKIDVAGAMEFLNDFD